jgi:hypothetical protein
MAGTLTISTLSDGTNSTSATNLVKAPCVAWVNFNGTGTVAIRASYNVSSITDNGTGDYTINYTNALADANYSFVVTGYNLSGSYVALSVISSLTAPSTTVTRVSCKDSSFGQTDSAYVNCAVFR